MIGLALEDVYKLQLLYRVDVGNLHSFFSGFVDYKTKSKVGNSSLVTARGKEVGVISNWEAWVENQSVFKVTGGLINFCIVIPSNGKESIHPLVPMMTNEEMATKQIGW